MPRQITTHISDDDYAVFIKVLNEEDVSKYQLVKKAVLQYIYKDISDRSFKTREKDIITIGDVKKRINKNLKTMNQIAKTSAYSHSNESKYIQRLERHHPPKEEIIVIRKLFKANRELGLKLQKLAMKENEKLNLQLESLSSEAYQHAKVMNAEGKDYYAKRYYEEAFKQAEERKKNVV